MRSRPAAPSATRRVPPGWRRLSKSGSKLATHWLHESGWHVSHCGHPTANWPYALRSTGWPGRSVVAFNGLGFATLKAACRTVEAIVAGELEVTAERCTPGTARVRGCTSTAERIVEDPW